MQKVVMITGAANGIGAAAARRFAREGVAVAVCDRDAVAGAATVEALVDAGHEALFVEVDVADTASVRAGVETIIDRYGRLDYGVNNAGIRATLPLLELEIDEWERVIDVDLTGVFRCMKFQAPHIVETQGAIVNTSSVWGLMGWPTRTAYAAAKHGVSGLTRSAAHELGEYGVRVNAVAPGPTATEAVIALTGGGLDDLVARTAMKKPGAPEDVADAMYFLATARNVTGVVLPVDGGWTAA